MRNKSHDSTHGDSMIIIYSFYLGHLSAIVEKAKGDGKIGELMLEWYDIMHAFDFRGYPLPRALFGREKRGPGNHCMCMQPRWAAPVLTREDGHRPSTCSHPYQQNIVTKIRPYSVCMLYFSTCACSGYSLLPPLESLETRL